MLNWGRYCHPTTSSCMVGEKMLAGRKKRKVLALFSYWLLWKSCLNWKKRLHCGGRSTWNKHHWLVARPRDFFLRIATRMLWLATSMGTIGSYATQYLDFACWMLGKSKKYSRKWWVDVDLPLAESKKQITFNKQNKSKLLSIKKTEDPKNMLRNLLG